MCPVQDCVSEEEGKQDSPGENICEIEVGQGNEGETTQTASKHYR